MTDPAAARLEELLAQWVTELGASREIARRLRALGERHYPCLPSFQGATRLSQRCKCGELWPCPDWEVLNGKEPKQDMTGRVTPRTRLLRG
jgi:hypothetical protein